MLVEKRQHTVIEHGGGSDAFSANAEKRATPDAAAKTSVEEWNTRRRLRWRTNEEYQTASRGRSIK
jgi:hypothetical protein